MKDVINEERGRQEQQAASRQQTGTDLFGANPPRLDTKKNGGIPSDAEQGRQGNQPEVSKPKEKITDFGEKLGGAKKDLWHSIKDSMEGETVDEIASLPLSKSWPEPNYQKLLEEGVDPWSRITSYNVCYTKLLRCRISMRQRNIKRSDTYDSD